MSWDFILKSQIYNYILTDDNNYILLGENEDEFLIWLDNSGDFINKNNGSYSFINKS